MKRLIGMMMLVMGGVLFVLPTEAHAITLYGSDDAGRMYIGKVNHGGTTSQWLCDDGPARAPTWTNLGNSSQLTASYTIHGDDSTAGCSSADCGDIIEIIRSNTTIAGDCAATSGQWSALLYGTYYVDIHGDEGNDVAVIGGAGNTYAYGDAGDDYVYQYSGSGRTYGGAGADNLFGNAGSADVLYGEADNDCLQDSNNSWTTYDCGTGTDRWYSSNTAAGKVSCENREDWCCGFC